MMIWICQTRTRSGFAGNCTHPACTVLCKRTIPAGIALVPWLPRLPEMQVTAIHLYIDSCQHAAATLSHAGPLTAKINVSD